MNKICLKSVLLQKEGEKPERYNVFIEGNHYSKIIKASDNFSDIKELCENSTNHVNLKENGLNNKEKSTKNFEVIDCKNYALLPAFYNGHCHSAMTLLRGYADDMELFTWLNNYIWPKEAKLTADDIKIGSRLAILEMIKSGTVFFSDMYMHREETINVVKEMGVRGTIGVIVADKIMASSKVEEHFEFINNYELDSDRINLAVMPHSVYTVTPKCLERCIQASQNKNYKLHVHLSETKKEVDDCINQYGTSPVKLLDSLGGINKNFVAAHCVHFTEEEMDIFYKTGAWAVLNPCSNLKLSSGIPPIHKFLEKKLNIALGTDGASSNNNLDMHEEMKFLALLAKVQGGPETLPAYKALELASENAALAYGIHGGKIEEGYLADGILVNLNDEQMTPCHNLISNWVYSANSKSIDSVICNGKFIMKHGHVEGEEDIIKEANFVAKRLMEK